MRDDLGVHGRKEKDFVSWGAYVLGMDGTTTTSEARRSSGLKTLPSHPEEIGSALRARAMDLGTHRSGPGAGPRRSWRRSGGSSVDQTRRPTAGDPGGESRFDFRRHSLRVEVRRSRRERNKSRRLHTSRARTSRLPTPAASKAKERDS